MSVQHSCHHINHFFKNKELNEMYFSYGIFNFALGLISIFIPIYLYNLGYSIPEILFFFFLTSLIFVIFSYSGAKIVSHFGVKHSMLITIPIFILFFIGLRFIDVYPFLFFILPILRAFKMILYNYSFHLNFLLHSDSKNRGKEVSMLQASAVFAGILSPFIGGVILKLTSFPVLFAVGSILLFAAMIPLFLSKDMHTKISFDREDLLASIFKKKNLNMAISFSGYAIESWVGLIIWPMFLYLMLFNFESIGAITSLTAFTTFLVFYFVGKATDKQDKRKLLRIGTFLYFFGWVGRIFVTGFSSAFIIDSYKNITQQVLFVPWSAYSYDLAAQKNYFKFIVRREIIFNLSRVLVIPILILIFCIDFYPFIISFSIAAIFSLFYMKLTKEKITK